VINLREYRSLDFDELWRIDQECFQEGIAYSRHELAWYMNRSRAFTLVAHGMPGQVEQKAGRRILGFVVAESDPSGVGHILTIDVRPDGQRTGVGSLLLEAAERRLVLEKCKAVLLETAVSNTAALAFYKHHGYSVIETIPRYYLNSIDALVMGKRLEGGRQMEAKRARVKKT
jgi:[ribosomal protein S18]-alanine N-acetyltransferase